MKKPTMSRNDDPVTMEETETQDETGNQKRKATQKQHRSKLRPKQESKKEEAAEGLRDDRRRMKRGTTQGRLTIPDDRKIKKTGFGDPKPKGGGEPSKGHRKIVCSSQGGTSK